MYGSYPASLGLMARKAVVRHIDRLAQSLDRMTQRVRDTVAETVAESLAGVIHETLHALLGRLTAPVSPPTWTSNSTEPWWQNAEDGLPEEVDDGGWSAYPDPIRWNSETATAAPRSAVAHEPPSAPRWRWPVMLGCQTAAWWLHPPARRSSILTVLGIGLATTFTAYLAGPSFLGAGLRLLGVADVVRSGTAALTALGVS